MRATVVQHGSPTGGWRRYTKAEKAHRSFGKNRSGHAYRGLHNDRLNNVRQDVPHDDAQVACPQRARRFDEFALARGEDLSADETSVTHPSAERESENKIENSRPSKCDERDGQQDSWKREKRIHQNHVDESIDASAVVSRDGTNDKTEAERGEYHAASDQHGNARTIDNAREDVAPKFVRAEPVRVRRSVESRRKIDRCGILGRDPGCKERKNYENDHESNADRRQRIMPCGTAQRDGGGGNSLILQEGWCRGIGRSCILAGASHGHQSRFGRKLSLLPKEANELFGYLRGFVAHEKA